MPLWRRWRSRRRRSGNWWGFWGCRGTRVFSKQILCACLRQAGARRRKVEGLMSIRKLVLLIFAAALLSEPLYAQQKRNSPCIARYEDNNQIDYGPLIVREVKGVVTDPVDAVPQACVGIFTEKDHKLVTATESDEDGKFSLQSIPPGRYRLVVKADPLCAANVRLRVVKHQKKKQILQVHMKPRGLDSCSYVDLGAQVK